MRSMKQRNVMILIAATAVLIVFFLMTLVYIDRLQGNARVVNYTGILRGATQKLIKNEMYGIQDDPEIARFDKIINELKTGEGSHGLILIRDFAYQEKLEVQNQEWKELKRLIYEFRKNESLENELYRVSETYFTAANEAVAAAETVSDRTAQKLKWAEYFSLLSIIVMVFTLAAQVITEIRNNREINKIAFIDQSTGLPNKLACEEQLKKNELLLEGTVCCFMFDLNDLKRVNDTFGHKVGDILLAAFAGALRRASPENMFAGRLGGDEFIGIMTQATSESVKLFENALYTEIQKMNMDGKNEFFTISFAYGYVMSEEFEDCTLRMLIDIADRRMYENKAIMKKISPVAV